MKRITLLLSILFAMQIVSCNSAKKLETRMNKYIGTAKADIMLEYGHNPVKDGWVEGLGRVLVYTDLKQQGLGVYATQYYRHTMFLLDQDFKCIGWSVRNEQMPFDRLDIRILKSSF